MIKRIFKKIKSLSNPIKSVEEQFNGYAMQYEIAEQVDGYVLIKKSKEVENLLNYVTNNLIEIIEDEQKVLDVGCGTGRYLHKLGIINKSIKLYGIDISKDTIEKFTQKNNFIVAAKVCDITSEIPTFNVVFDVIYSITVLQYIPVYKLKYFFTNINRVLHRNGKFYLQFPSSNAHYLKMYTSFIYTRYNPTYIDKLANKYGFEIVKKGYLNEREPYQYGYEMIFKKVFDV